MAMAAWTAAEGTAGTGTAGIAMAAAMVVATAIAEAIGALTAPGFRGPLAGAFGGANAAGSQCPYGYYLASDYACYPY
jgi:hypothetical protein